MQEIFTYHRKKTSFPKPHAQPLAKLAKILCPPFPSPLFALRGHHKRMASKSYVLRKFLRKRHKHNAKLNKNLEVSIQSSSLKQINISSKSFKN